MITIDFSEIQNITEDDKEIIRKEIDKKLGNSKLVFENNATLKLTGTKESYTIHIISNHIPDLLVHYHDFKGDTEQK